MSKALDYLALILLDVVLCFLVVVAVAVVGGALFVALKVTPTGTGGLMAVVFMLWRLSMMPGDSSRWRPFDLAYYRRIAGQRRSKEDRDAIRF